MLQRRLLRAQKIRIKDVGVKEIMGPAGEEGQRNTVGTLAGRVQSNGK